VPSAQEKEKDSLAEVIGTSLSLLPIYMALSATTHEAGASEERITASVGEKLPEIADDERFLRAAQEVARAAGGELHNISALTGGMVAQEAIKIITKQYIPVDNTCVFDGINSRCQVLRL
jgi:NEDD8-activating enzyme E1 regulatory subunit